ncbi:MAG: cbb3-type cytochrome c oxidase subunit I [Elusimicrobia bacterium]|nr:cbb3-type cytochrome c oxidase subunit I [Elusimicrobiota bacterium]
MTNLIRGLVSFGVASLAVAFLLARALPREAAASLGYLVGLFAFLIGVGGLAAFQHWLKDKEEEQVHGWQRYFRFTTDHKVIGVQYLVTSLVVFVLAGVMALVIRVELAKPGLQFLSYDTYNTVMGIHGIGMIVVALIAIIGGLGNFSVPLMIGTKDMAFPRLNALSFWILPPAVLLLLSSLVTGGFDFGWTAYPPLSVRGPLGKLFFVLAFISVGFSSIFGGVNFVATISQLRAKGMSLFKMPIFVWSILAAGIIIVLATSVVASALLMILFDRVLGTTFFDPSQGGNVLLYQHLFWFYSHPAVYIMILPAFGVILELLPVYARKPLFAYRLAALSFVAIVVLSFVVWAHHLFTSGMWDALSIPFMVTTELISVPTGVVFLSALGTLWLGKLQLKTPMLFALGFLVNFLIGGLTGIFNADVPTDLHLQDTWFVVAHFHFTIMGGAIFAWFAGIYHWFPKITGKMYNETLGKIHFWLLLIGFNATFIPMFWLGTRGMRRRVADFPPDLASVQLWISLVGLMVVLAVAVFLFNMIRSWVKGESAPSNPWEARTLEWNP